MCMCKFIWVCKSSGYVVELKKRVYACASLSLSPLFYIILCSCAHVSVARDVRAFSLLQRKPLNVLNSTT